MTDSLKLQTYLYIAGWLTSMTLSSCFTCQLFHSKPWILNWDWRRHTWSRVAKGQIWVAECWLQKMWWVHWSPKHRQAAAAAWLHCWGDFGGESSSLGWLVQPLHTHRMKRREQREVGSKGASASSQPGTAYVCFHLFNEKAFDQAPYIPFTTF